MPGPYQAWQSDPVLECVVNVSEGRDREVLARLEAACGSDLLDRHSDEHHHRSVFTLVGEDAPRRLTRAAVELLTIHAHDGAHPRLGVVDVVPFVPLHDSTIDDARRARDDFAHWVAHDLRVPVFVYGPLASHETQLPDIRRTAWIERRPDLGPTTPHATAGSVCVGARELLVAYNVWLDRSVDRATLKRIADDVRGDGIRSLPLVLDGRPQVSMNLIEPMRVGPDVAFDRVSASCDAHGAHVDCGELVGLLPRALVERIDARRWKELDVSLDGTIEARLERAR